jgi:hypothetical protein
MQSKFATHVPINSKITLNVAFMALFPQHLIASLSRENDFSYWVTLMLSK